MGPLASKKLRLAVGVAACSGFVALSYEIVWYRVLSVATGGTAATFGLLLAAYLAGLAAGARASGVLCEGEGGDPRALRLLSAFVAGANVLAALVAPALAWSAGVAGLRVGLVAVVVAAGGLGAVLPLVSHFGIAPDERAGARLAYVYVANILGSAAGSLLTGFVLMDRLAIHGAVSLLAVTGFGLAAALVVASGARGHAALAWYGGLAGSGALFVLALPALHHGLYERLVYKEAFAGQRFVQVVENKSGVILVAEDGTVYGGGAYDGVVNTRLDENEKNGILRAYVLGGLHPAPRDVLMVGLSSGSWAQVVVHLPGVERLTIVEINPGYLEVVARHPEVRSLLSNPKVRIVVDDGRRWMQRNADRFDVIVMNTTMHWRGHATSLLSTEFLELARQRLRAPAGVLYFNTTDSYDVQLTAATAFPQFMRLANFVAVSDGPLRFDRERWAWVLGTMTIDGERIVDAARPEHARMYRALLGYNDLEYRDTVVARAKDAGARVVTDDNMVVEWRDPLRAAR